MRRKLITALCLSLLFTAVFGLQIASTANAETKNKIPLTSPLTYFQISGKVTYKFFQIFIHGTQRIVPAAGVTIEAENIITHDIYQTTTDSNGNYSLSIEEKGFFTVKPSGGNTNTYIPPLQFVSINKKGTQDNVDFQGYILK
jgi:hypothetical protein